LSSSLHKNILTSKASEMELSFKKSLTNHKNAVKLSFDNLKYTVNVPCSNEEMQKNDGAKTKEMDVLKNLSGFALPG